MPTDKKLGRGFKVLERETQLIPRVQIAQQPQVDVPAGQVQPAAPPAQSPKATTPPSIVAPPDAAASEKAGREETVAQIPLKYVSPNPYQPRFSHDEAGLQELMNSISASGLLQPILVRRARGGYQIIAGHRRYEASKRLGLDAIPAIVRDMDDRGMLEMSLLENIQRKDLDPVEKSRALERLETEFGLTHVEIGRRLGMNRSTVSNHIRLLELPDEILAHVSRGTLTMGHARALLAIEGVSARLAACNKILRDGMSVRDIEEEASSSQTGTAKGRGRPKKGSKTAYLKQIERALQQMIGYRVTVTMSSKGSGRMAVKFRTTAEFNDVYERISSAFGK